MPAPIPPKKPARAGRKGVSWKPGFMMQRLPRKATTTAPICTASGFSRRSQTEKRMAKKGESLLSMLASARAR